MRAGRRFHFERQQRDRATLRKRSLFPPFANCAKDGAPHIVWNCQRDKKDWATRRLYRWPLGPRPEGHPGLSELGL